jgi:hypothetical protein
MTQKTGFAVNQNGELLINTVSETKRGALVNYLHATLRIPIMDHMKDEEIVDIYRARAPLHGAVLTVVEVSATREVDVYW